MRAFVGILVAFVAFVAVLVAVFAWQGRAAREYGREAAQVAGRRGLTSRVECAAVVGRPLPGSVERCTVTAENGRPTATLTLEGGRVFRVGP